MRNLRGVVAVRLHSLRTVAVRLIAWWVRRAREQELELARLRQLYRESERYRAELSHLEHEIYGIRESGLSRRQKSRLESALRGRCRLLESEMLRRQNEIAASGHLLLFW
ncbi:MAG: hypothetical protein FJX77_03545 [Armatimonadetes bacterium]|nr:hypothetical protein [Armatimonadota bacterium]